ncbi:putative phenylacetate 2-hydroxylase [[Candida] railenensis]|uniref:Phenylacetate 2-hydroxylase n=1 Tax=[Candida] railenensis TaxID=45579 RepID=A0A9P0VW86_9ASCO|nr:putative phenylacetate 2-hydroxylase [[Candida] railenensis]
MIARYITNWPIAACFAILIVGLVLWVILDKVLGLGAPPIIPSLPSMNNDGWPIVGNFPQLLENPSLILMNWSKRTSSDIFQIRLGIKRVVVVNSFKDSKVLANRFACSTNSRPISYVFHNLVSATQGFTVGSTPAGQSYKLKKKAVAMSLNQKNVDSFSELLDIETCRVIKNILLTNSELHCMPSCYCPKCCITTELSDISLMSYFQLFVLKVALALSYGLNIDTYKRNREFAEEIIRVENTIINLRSPGTNMEDFIPILRFPPFSYFSQSNRAKQYRDRRDKYMNELMINLQFRLEQHDNCAKNSIVGKLIQTSSQNNLSSVEIQSICLTLISAGLDNTPLNFNHLMGQLSQPHTGSILQQKAFHDISSQYKGDIIEAWDSVAYSMKCQYVLALIYETLRYFTVLPLSLPRQTTKEIDYLGYTIPKGTTIFFNAYAANHDSREFPDPMKFNPDRWLDQKTKRINQNMTHFSFGEGSRKCSGNILVIKELYTLTCRMIILFKIRPPTNSRDLMGLDPFQYNSNKCATSFEPKLFKVKLEKRNFLNIDQLYSKIDSW